MVRLSTLRLNPNNPRHIADDSFLKLVINLLRYPKILRERPLVHQERMIIGGNQRYKGIQHIMSLPAAKFAQAITTNEVTPAAADVWTSVRKAKAVPAEWIADAKDYTQAEVDAFIALDNVSFGTWDFDKLKAAWDTGTIEGWGIDLPETKDPDPQLSEDGYVPPPPEQIHTDIQPGELFQIGPHRLFCGDSRSTDHVAQLLAGVPGLPLVVTDPPYNVNYEGGTDQKLKIENDDMSDQEFYKFLAGFFNAWVPHTAPGGAWYVWHADTEGLNFRRAFIDSGLLLKQCLIWVKHSLVMGRQDYHWRHEPCQYGWKPGAAHYFINDRTQTTVIENQVDYSKLKKQELLDLVLKMTAPDQETTVLHYPKPLRNDIHPTMKPVIMIGRLIANSSRPGEPVGDGFIGSGTTMVACHQLDPTLQITRNGKPYQPPTQPKKK